MARDLHYNKRTPSSMGQRSGNQPTQEDWLIISIPSFNRQRDGQLILMSARVRPNAVGDVVEEFRESLKESPHAEAIVVIKAKFVRLVTAV